MGRGAPRVQYAVVSSRLVTGPAVPSELDLLRREYESSLSWRITRPLRAVGRVAREARSAAPPEAIARRDFTPGRYDSWLEHFHGDTLGRIDAACLAGGAECFALFRDLDVDLWALLLTQEYESYPNIRSLLPSVPDTALQRIWNGASGTELADQSKSFYIKLRERFAHHSGRSLAAARVLDFGCGWGRLTRFLARDVEPGHLYGCDPVEAILDVCRENGVPAKLARTDFFPERLPFGERFDLAFAFSVFTHISEAAHESCLRALHRAIRPEGILVVTIRPPEYLHSCERMQPLLRSLGSDYMARLDEPRYLFAAHPPGPRHLQYAGGEMTYGESVITLPYIRQRWSPMFELLQVDLLVGDVHQVVLTLARR
jgi:SAM-dependent methyltransferase